jgi:3-hydroxyisobutyrate dehydrogenase-like beta-hydroxyacid dehydrogenase
VVVDTSTVSPATSREMHALAAERGVDYLDAPVSGGEPLQGGVDGARAARTDGGGPEGPPPCCP